MKTAISLPDDLFESADALAGRLGISRSQLYAAALAEYVAKHRTARVTERLDAVYAAEPSQLDRSIAKSQKRKAKGTEW
jgi:metal-responsive CopG/Arc/MetJ family transcriptional regulator